MSDGNALLVNWWTARSQSAAPRDETLRSASGKNVVCGERERESFFLSLLLLELHISQRIVYQQPVTLPELILKIGADLYVII